VYVFGYDVIFLYSCHSEYGAFGETATLNCIVQPWVATLLCERNQHVGHLL